MLMIGKTKTGITRACIGEKPMFKKEEPTITNAWKIAGKTAEAAMNRSE